MAKKTVASLQKKEARNIVKVIKPAKSKKTGSYTFKEEMVPVDMVDEYLKKSEE